MNKLLLLILILFFSLADMALGYEIVVLKSSLNKINNQVQHDFIEEIGRQAPHHGLKKIQRHQLTEIVITKGNAEISRNKIRNSQPDLILALGAKALKVALSVPDIPIVHLLVIDPEKIVSSAKNVTGVALAVPPKTQLEELSRYLPSIKRIGIVYDPKRSSKFIEQLDSIRPDLKFISLATENPAEVPALINTLRGRVDLLWMLPDLTTTNRKTMQSYFLFSIKNKVPLLTFSEKFLKHGATIAVTFDIEAMVEQAAELAIDMLSGRGDGEPPTIVAPHPKTVINHKIAAKLNISITNGGENLD